ncbi:MAG TPA: hypothetical protein VF711_12345 [Acidimicrobiales bacterium]
MYRVVVRAMGLSQLSTSVEQVVADLMEAMNGYPAQRPLSPTRVVVYDASVPVVGTQAAKDVGKQLRRDGELTGHVIGFLLCVAIVVDSFVAAHGLERRSIPAPGGEHTLTLHQQHVPHMAAVLQRGPPGGLSPAPCIGAIVAEQGGEFSGTTDDG